MRHALLLVLPLLALVPSPAVAQHHEHSTASTQPATPPAENDGLDAATVEGAPVNETGLDAAQPETSAPAPVTDHSKMDHSQMDHGSMDHSQMDHSQMDHGAMNHASTPVSNIPQSPPPPEAFSGPQFAADAYVGADKMAKSRKAVAAEVSGMPVFWFQADRAEARMRKGRDGYLWDVQGFYGGDIDKFWFKSEGEGAFGEKLESADVQALWSHAVDPWWDVQLGVKQNLTGPGRTHAVLGIQGLAPYYFEIDAAAFLSTKGDLTAKVEAELDQRITQRLILQPRAEIALSAQDIPELGIGRGFEKAELGGRLRYEIAREFAPYIGIEQEWKLGKTGRDARAAGEHRSSTNFVAGVRFWF